MTFANTALLSGLFLLALPPIIHLFSRRKYDVVDWAAMQFLQASQKTRRKVYIEELLLMLFRMLLLAVFVMALSGPSSDWPLFRKLARQPSRDAVIIVDGSLSMGYKRDGKSARETAIEWAKAYLGDLRAGDRVAVIDARQKPHFVVPTLTADLVQVGNALDNLPAPRGGINWPAAVQMALESLQGSKNKREIVLLSDGQSHGWSDEATLMRWELMARSQKPDDKAPKIWAVNVVEDAKEIPVNWSIGPIVSTRPVVPAGREVKFKSELQLHLPPQKEGENEKPPQSIDIEIDGRPAGKEKPFASADARGRIPFAFTQRFATPGSHLVAVMVEEDALPGDNRREYAIDVIPSLPILFVDGEERGIKLRGSDFLRDALAPIRDTTPAFHIRVVSVDEFNPELLKAPLSREAASVPRVLVLSNVPKLNELQAKAIEKFASDGGGVLVCLGAKCEFLWYNEQLFRDGKGWLPGRLVAIQGDEKEIDKAPQIVPQSLEHPALELFKEAQPGSLSSAYFPRYWKVDVPPESGGSVIGSLNNRLPFFAEKTYGRGRTILCSVPLDNSWRTNLVDLGDFVRLSHELMYYLAGTSGMEKNIAAGQAIVFSPLDGEAPGAVTIVPPEGATKRVEVDRWPLIFDETREVGAYTLTTAAGKVTYFVVQPDAGESQLSLQSEADRNAVAKWLPNMKYVAKVEEIAQADAESQGESELWWMFLVLLMVFLGFELYMTRRIALRHPPSWD